MAARSPKQQLPLRMRDPHKSTVQYTYRTTNNHRFTGHLLHIRVTTRTSANLQYGLVPPRRAPQVLGSSPEFSLGVSTECTEQMRLLVSVIEASCGYMGAIWSLRCSPSLYAAEPTLRNPSGCASTIVERLTTRSEGEDSKGRKIFR